MKISFIGSGNVATHLAKAFRAIDDVDILQIISRTELHAQRLARQVGADATSNLQKLDPDFDLLIISISDDAITKVISQLDISSNKPIVHTAGSVPSEWLCKASEQFGVFYPLQTFSKRTEIDWQEVPILITASSREFEKKLLALASKLSPKTQAVDDEQRFAIHLAAVVACNFSNAIWTMAHNICTRNEIAFDLLRPLIEETLSKIWEMPPGFAQTGPAKRNDQSTMQNHLVSLDVPLEKEIYALLSAYIMSQEKTAN